MSKEKIEEKEEVEEKEKEKEPDVGIHSSRRGN